MELKLEELKWQIAVLTPLFVYINVGCATLIGLNKK